MSNKHSQKFATLSFSVALALAGVAALLWLLGGLPQAAFAQEPVGTAFTYQGQLIEDGSPVNDTCDFEFELYDEASGGTQVGSTINMTRTVNNGLFTAQLDFGADAFQGDARWLRIRVQCPGDPDYTDLGRQELTPAPYALALPGLWTQQNATSPNLIGGYSGNSVTAGVYGATIGGGGEEFGPNRVTNDYGTVGGGYNNQAGYGPSITQTAPYATVGGGRINTASGDDATVSGGWDNTASDTAATVCGGFSNTASANYATVCGGDTNTASGSFVTVGGGTFNVAGSPTTGSATVGGGDRNTASGSHSTVGGGLGNTAGGEHAIVGGGWGNTASGQDATVGGGVNNTASGNYATVGGGLGNTASWQDATVGGGWGNTASMIGATVGGGESNTASGYVATVPGGGSNVAQGNYSFAAGRQARALQDGTFVWADDTDAPFASTAANQFLIRASGGVGIGTTSPAFKLDVVGDRIRLRNSTAAGAKALELRVDGDAVDLMGTNGDLFIYTNPGRVIMQPYGGQVGIGTAIPDPAAKLDVAGRTRTSVLEITGGGDLAEPFEIAGAENVAPGMVVAIDPAHPGQLRIADKAYDRAVAGCVSGANGVNPGLTMQQEGTVADGAFPVALSGRVYCRADAAYGVIQPGDLLTTSDTSGHVMKVTDYSQAQGAIIGKAMSALTEGQELILVLVSLQ